MKTPNKKHANNEIRKDAIAMRIADKIVKAQEKVAKYLNNQVNVLSLIGRLLLLILFCIVFTAVNLYLLIHSFK